MKVLRIALIVAICGVILFSLSCSGSSATPAATQTSTVKKGNIGINVTATGNLAFTRAEDLAFDVAGTVKDVTISVGDTVTEGQVLAELDTDSLEDAVKTAERSVKTQEQTVKKAEQSVTTAQTAVTTAQEAVTTAQDGVATAEENVKASERSVKSAEYDLETATNAYYKLVLPNPFTTYRFTLPESVDAIKVAEARMKEAQALFLKALTEGQSTVADGMDKITEAQQLLATAETQLGWWFSTPVTDNMDYWTLRSAQNNVDKSKISLDTARSNLEKTKKTVDTAKAAVDKAKAAVDTANENVDTVKENLDLAKEDLNDARDKLKTAQDNVSKAVISAPFAGIVIKVNVEGGDEIGRGTVAIQIADPTKFEASVLVSERDISSIKIGAAASVTVDVMNASLPAKVTKISPTATISQGVVNYSVTVEVQSATVKSGSQQGTAQTEVSAKAAQARLKQAVEQGRMTQQQADELINQMNSGQMPQFSQGQAPSTTTPQAVTLKQGLSITITIPILQKNDVLLVPNRAISRQGKDTVVQVTKNDVIETRVIKTGLSDLSNTEVTEGLAEGEQIVLPTSTTSSTSSTTQRSGTGGMMFPIGGPR